MTANPDGVRLLALADAIEKADWSGSSIGNKELLHGAVAALCAAPARCDAGSISPSDPRVIIAGIRQFGLAPDGSDLRDLEAALATPPALPAGEEVRRLCEALEEIRDGYGPNHGSKFARDKAAFALSPSSNGKPA